MYFFHPNLRTLNMYALASFKFGFRWSNISKNDKNILCKRQNHVLVEFFQTKREKGKEDHGHSQQIKLNNFTFSLWDKRKEVLYPISIAMEAVWAQKVHLEGATPPSILAMSLHSQNIFQSSQKPLHHVTMH